LPEPHVTITPPALKSSLREEKNAKTPSVEASPGNPFDKEDAAVVAAKEPSESVAEHFCIVEGDVNTTHNWFGFIQNISLLAGGGFRYYFTYPYAMQTQNVIMYNDKDIVHLHWEQTCWQKEIIINSMLVPEQILDLSPR